MFAQEHDTLRFYVGKIDEDKFVAISKDAPCFCVEATTEKGAVQEALNAWTFYLKATGKQSKVHVKLSTPFESIVKSFIPSQAVLAEAC